MILPDSDNLARLQAALDDLEAGRVAVPYFESEHLLRGHAIHFRCRRADVTDLRIDLMASLRGVAPFEDLWGRRTTIEVDGCVVDMLALEDLVTAKKTQLDEDWSMIRRLVERSYFADGGSPDSEKVRFWLRELRTPELLIAFDASHPEAAGQRGTDRPLLNAARRGDRAEVERRIEEKELRERRSNREYWEPLKRALERFRRSERN